MKKLLYLEIAVLALLLIVAGFLFFGSRTSTLPPSNAPTTLDTSVPTEETTIPTETTVPTEETTIPTEGTTAPTDESTAPTDESTAPTDGTSTPTHPTTTPTQPTEAPTQPSTAPTQPTEAPTQPTEAPTDPSQPYQLSARDYFVYDCKTGSFLVNSGNGDTKIYPASITKLFTAYVALQYLQPDTKVTAGDALALVPWDSSIAQIQREDVLTVSQLVEAMLLPSGNDAAYLLACEAGRAIRNNPELGARYAVISFVAEMNSRAAQLGMTGTHFTNPDGYHDSEHYTTLGDIVAWGKLALANDLIMQYAGKAQETVTLHEQAITWKNTNALLHTDSTYYNPYAVGLKTGQTGAAGSCLLSAFRKDDRELLIGVFGCPEDKDRFSDTLHLFNKFTQD